MYLKRIDLASVAWVQIVVGLDFSSAEETVNLVLSSGNVHLLKRISII